MLTFSRLTITALVLGLSSQALALDIEHEVQRHQTRLSQADWLAVNDASSCQLVHAIESYGDARFEQRVGEALKFHVRSDMPQHIDSRAQLLLMPAQWQSRGEPVTLAEIEVRSGHSPVAVDTELARRMFDGLMMGRFSALRFPVQGQYTTTRELVITPVHFRQAIPDFDSCRARLAQAASTAPSGPVVDLPGGELQTSIFFTTDSAELTAAAVERLDEIAEEFLAQPAGTRMQLLGHSDSRGSRVYNRRLAEQRLFAVRFHLVTRGVPLELINARPVDVTVAQVEAASETQEAPDPQELAQSRRVDVLFMRD